MLKNTPKQSKFIDNKIENLNDILSTDLVIGKKIIADENTTLIPVTKALIGYINGSGEYGEIKLFSKEKNLPQVGGGGAIVNISPTGFLIVKKDSVEFLKINDSFEMGVFDKTIDFIKNNIYEKN